MRHINEALIPGIQSLLNLLIMLDKALVLTKASSIIPDSQWDWIGYHFKFVSQEYWIGLRFDRPNVLIIEIDEIDPMIYKQLDLGYVYYWEEYEYWCWIHELDLSSDVIRFFELSKSDQLQCIEQFIKKSLDAVKRIQSLQTKLTN